MTPIDLSNLGTTVGSTTAKTSNNATDPEASQDRFLKLLVAQINNQDPLNPMDNAQMTTQMAQINTVSGIQELNATLKGMAAQMTAAQSLQGASLIGRDVLMDGDTLQFEGS
ncbi:MAG: flagellar hook capping FlgD N-terminal domain-containing protein, partial [Burkholderiaceae bacterium]